MSIYLNTSKSYENFVELFNEEYFVDKAVDSKEIFDGLNISRFDSYEKNLNKYNVINISFNDTCDKGNRYEDYIDVILKLKHSYIV